MTMCRPVGPTDQSAQKAVEQAGHGIIVEYLDTAHRNLNATH